jgi:hypothetical protein
MISRFVPRGERRLRGCASGVQGGSVSEHRPVGEQRTLSRSLTNFNGNLFVRRRLS